ncbi:sulfite exporter TauE/SafE family protein [Chloroflexota bacterium]
MTTVHIVILLITGAAAGFAGGLLGIGGAFIMTPVQYAIFTAMGISTDIAIKLAFGTSLLVVLPTVVSGAWRHSKKGAVQWKVAIIMGSCGLLAASGGATMATHLPGTALKIAFGVIALAAAIRMLTTGNTEVKQELMNNPWLWAVWAIPIGILTGILGVGGGVMAVPVLVLVLGFRMHNAVATSLAIIIFTSIGGAAGYIINGLGVPNLPDYSIGYIHLPSAFLLAVGSINMAQVGAVTAHRLPAKQLKYIFVTLTIYMGLRMVGVFDWLGLPI